VDAVVRTKKTTAGLTVNVVGTERIYTVKVLLIKHGRKFALNLKRSWQSMDSDTIKTNHSSEEDKYVVFDEMAMEVLLETADKKAAEDKAYDHQCVLSCNGKVIHDYSCEY
jgi:hypothetical protein